MGLIVDIKQKVEAMVVKIFYDLCCGDYSSFLLFLSRADVMPILEGNGLSKYVVDYCLDLYNDETREQFYIKYLNKRYNKEGFDYSDEDGIYDLNVEMMIYCHLWESFRFLKDLARISFILKQKAYNWEVEIPKYKLKNFIREHVQAPLKDVNNELAAFFDDVYSPNLRNAFAHSSYSIDKNNRKIELRSLEFDKDDKVQSQISFDEFQKKFLTSIIFHNSLVNAIVLYRKDCGKSASGNAISDVIKMPDGTYCQIFADWHESPRGAFPSFSIKAAQNPLIHKYKPGDFVYFGNIRKPIEVLSVEEHKNEQFVKLFVGKKRCISTMLSVADNTSTKDNSDYSDIKLFLK